MSPDIFITGLDAVTPIGTGLDHFWKNLLAGKSGVDVQPLYAADEWPFAIGSAVTDFDPEKYLRPRKSLKFMCRAIQMGCVAAKLAADQAGLGPDSADPNRIATIIGADQFLAEPREFIDAFRVCSPNRKFDYRLIGQQGIKQIEPLLMLKYLPNMVATHIGISLDARGPTNTIVQRDVSALIAILSSAELLRRDWADIAIAGGTGTNLQPTNLIWNGTAGLSRRIHEPQQASRPFDALRDGWVNGEGSGAIVLETEISVRRRGVTPIARLSGWSHGFLPMSDPRFSDQVARICAEAIARAGLQPIDIQQVNANGLSGVVEDHLESRAIQMICPHAPVMAIKHHMGHLGTGASIVELVAGVLAMRHGVIPGAINYMHPDPKCPINLSRHNRSEPQDNLLKLGFNSTGQIVALVISRVL